MGSPLAQIIGTWRGHGAGEFPTMDPFTYEEEISFVDLGAPAIVYQQRAWSSANQEVLHLETGLWRPGDRGRLAVTIALPRVTEISEGQITDGRIDLSSTSVSRAEGGAGLVAVRRSYRITGDTLAYEIVMATAEVSDLRHHVTCVLQRAAPVRAKRRM